MTEELKARLGLKDWESLAERPDGFITISGVQSGARAHSLVRLLHPHYHAKF